MSYDHRFLYAYFSGPEAYPRFQAADFAQYAKKCITTPMGEVHMVIVGESHVLSIPALRYQEVFVSRRLAAPDLLMGVRTNITASATTPVTGGVMRFHCTGTSLDPNTLAIWRQSATLSYAFAPQAWTILRIQQQTISTLHSYPQWDRMVITKTVYEQS